MSQARFWNLVCSIAFFGLASCGPESKPSTPALAPTHTEDPQTPPPSPEPLPEPARNPDWFDSCVPKYRDTGRREPERQQVVTVTAAAVAKIQIAAAEMKGWYVRIRVEVFRDGSGTPTGFKNRVDLDFETYPEIDLIDESQGVPVVIDRRSADLLGGWVLDWLEGKDGPAGFKLEKPSK